MNEPQETSFMLDCGVSGGLVVITVVGPWAEGEGTRDAQLYLGAEDIRAIGHLMLHAADITERTRTHRLVKPTYAVKISWPDD